MTHSLRTSRLALAFAAALALAAAPTHRARGADDSGEPTKEERKAAEREAKQAKQAAEREAEEAKKEAKREAKQEKSSGKQTKEQKRRAQIETSARTAIDWYGEALRLYQRGKYLDARAILLPLEDSARAVDIQERVKLLIADTYFEQGGALNLAEALARYKSFLTFFPSSEHAAYAQYQLGRSYFKQLGDPDRDQSFTDQAIFEYQKLIDNYPGSEFVARAEKEILEAKARRAQHEFEVAQFYWDWNDKQACATRLMQVLKERPELPAREKALWMCAQALYDTGRREEGDAYAARLRADYPGSAYASRLDPDSPGAIEKQVKRERKHDKDLQRTYRAQAKTDRRRTRLIRKDSGLPADVPQTWDLSGSTTPAASSAPAAAGEAGADAKDDAKAARRADADREAAEKAEREEQEQRAKQQAREKERAEKQAKEDAKRAEKKAAEGEALANETPEQKAKREKREAKHRKEVERLEAEEAKKAEKAKQKEEKKK